MMADRLVTLKRQGEIAVVSLNRPARHNALVPELLSQLLASFKHQHCQTARAVILRAERVAFVHQIQSQQATDGIDQFLRRQEYA